MASTAKVDLYAEIAEAFMRVIFGWEPGDYLISDLSTMGDFGSDAELQSQIESVRQAYGLNVDEKTYLVDIFARINLWP